MLGAVKIVRSSPVTPWYRLALAELDANVQSLIHGTFF